ncbi:alpha/beta fold hydrolase [Fredinandcohnia sp. 179-A 10B2 NHS]|uniref:S9 family peptidase n=1 Tax=Fredinandcohnia sp. 179-A 10B2 NHS TaxID=3235176 RepID=UPI00399FC8C9
MTEKTQRTVKKYTIEQFINTESIMYNSISYNAERILYSSNKTGIFNAFSIGINDGSSVQLTNSTDDAIYAVSYFPNDQRILYLSDKGGNEILHIFVREEDGSVRDVTPGEQERALFYGWSKDEKSFYYGSNKRNPSYMDVYEMSIEDYSSTLLFQNDEGYEFSAISPDKNLIALRKISNSNKSDMFLYNVSTKTVTDIVKVEGDVQYIPQMFNADCTELYYVTDEDTEFLHLKKYNLVSGHHEVVAKDNWDIEFATFSPRYSYLVYRTNKDASSEMKVINQDTNTPVVLQGIPEGQITSLKISKNEDFISLMISSSHSPDNLYVYSLKTDSLTRLTDTLNPEIIPEDLVKAEVIRYPSFDGLEIPAIYYRPHVAEGEKVPALVFVHGGPGGQSTTNYNPMFQYIVNHGYAVIAVNNRGSSGYGKTFFKAADLKHGEVDLADCVAAKTFLNNQDYIDSERIGIIGGSYGGYMVLAALAFRPDEFKVGVDIFGVSNWERTLKSIPAWWESMRDALYKKLGNPYTQTDYIRSISPLFHADKINKPLIVLQGSNDPRVLQVESDEIVEALRKNNVPVEYVVFPDEGHGFTKKENRITGYQQIVEFLNQYL